MFLTLIVFFTSGSSGLIVSILFSLLASSVESCWSDGNLLTVLKGSVGLLPVRCSYPIVFARSDNSISDIRPREAEAC